MVLLARWGFSMIFRSWPGGVNFWWENLPMFCCGIGNFPGQLVCHAQKGGEYRVPFLGCHFSEKEIDPRQALAHRRSVAKKLGLPILARFRSFACVAWQRNVGRFEDGKMCSSVVLKAPKRFRRSVNSDHSFQDWIVTRFNWRAQFCWSIVMMVLED